MCSEEGCGRAATVGPLCKYHYNKKRLASITRICKTVGCGRTVTVKDVCTRCYNAEHYPKRIKKNI